MITSPLNLLIISILWIYVHSPMYIINEFIDGLQITQNPDTYLKPPEIIERHGYPVETYNIQTPDGFILELHRIPYGIRQGAGNQYPILLIHGYLDSSFSWIANGPEGALAYLLADQGYDVWMINVRGNTYSRSHASYTPMEQKFWDFSFHEIGVYDVPTTIDFILSKTNHKQLLCIADSAGNTETYIMLSVLPEYNEKIIAMISLAPYYYDSHPAVSVINTTSYDTLLYLYQNTAGSFIERDLLTRIIVQIMSMVQIFGYSLYAIGLSLSYGWFTDHINQEIMPVLSNNFPAGTSLKTTLHLLQLKNSFSYFDYGTEENLKTYNTTFPPTYNLDNIQIPLRIYYANLDSSAIAPEVESLYRKLTVKAGLIKVSDPRFTHLDFVWNKNAKELVYDDVITFMNDILSTNTSTETYMLQ